jgi:hypothetical protein
MKDIISARLGISLLVTREIAFLEGRERSGGNKCHQSAERDQAS